MICRPPVEDCERDTLEIRDISHELLECLPQAANLERIRTVLKGSAWGGLESDTGMSNSKKRKRGEGRRWTRAQLDSVVQASEGELERGLRERNVVELDGESCMPSGILGLMLIQQATCYCFQSKNWFHCSTLLSLSS
jgi:sister chromatid cohesion protein DCC1